MRKVASPSKAYLQSVLVGALIGIGIALVFAAGFFFRDLVGSPTALAFPGYASDRTLSTDGYPLLDEVQTLLDRYYLGEQPDPTERQYAAIRGVLSTLQDRYTFFIEPPVAQSESDVLAGTYGGIGVQLQRAETGELVLFPFDDGPAAGAGVEAGDVLLAINGEPVDLALPQDTIDQLLRGEVKPDNGVELTIRKVVGDLQETLFILFDVINVPSVVWRVLPEDEAIGYVQVLRFTARTPDELTTAMTELGEAEITGLILDLRNNSGGLLQEAIAVTDEFLDDGVLVHEESVDEDKIFEGNSGGVAIEQPLVVLVNAGTASGAELVAGAIQDYGRGLLIGQITYGKGTVQQIFPLSDGSSLHVTSAEWFTPNRNELSDVGLTPDIEMIPDENGRDVELGEAIRQLRQQIAEQDEQQDEA